ncbi:MAG: hypothetical protein IKV00_07700 [Clostridia bacterium]|nr:hypothetical protein [Clostridia bacterium]
MRWKDFAKEHRSVVVLGLPPTPVRYLLALRRKTGLTPILFARRIPFSLVLFPVVPFCRRVTDVSGELLVMELRDLAARHRERQLILLPADAESRRFAEQYRAVLETNYVIRDEDLGEGDLI